MYCLKCQCFIINLQYLKIKTLNFFNYKTTLLVFSLHKDMTP